MEYRHEWSALENKNAPYGSADPLNESPRMPIAWIGILGNKHKRLSDHAPLTVHGSSQPETTAPRKDPKLIDGMSLTERIAPTDGTAH